MLTEYRCKRCNHLLFKGQLTVAVVEIRCTNGNCRAFNMFEYDLAALDRPRVVAVG